jgi:hypothetical protein
METSYLPSPPAGHIAEPEAPKMKKCDAPQHEGEPRRMVARWVRAL